MIFARIDIQKRLGSLLKIKGFFRDISVRLRELSPGNYDFGPSL